MGILPLNLRCDGGCDSEGDVAEKNANTPIVGLRTELVEKEAEGAEQQAPVDIC